MVTVLENKKINDIAQKQVMAALREILNDPDRGLVFRQSFIRKLNKSISSKKAGKVKNLLDVLAKY